jgi:hypothetical protein
MIRKFIKSVMPPQLYDKVSYFCFLLHILPDRFFILSVEISIVVQAKWSFQLIPNATSEVRRKRRCCSYQGISLPIPRFSSACKNSTSRIGRSNLQHKSLHPRLEKPSIQRKFDHLLLLIDNKLVFFLYRIKWWSTHPDSQYWSQLIMLACLCQERERLDLLIMILPCCEPQRQLTGTL